LTFDSFGLPSIVLANITKLGYTAPTPIQERAIPAAMEGRDLMGLAQTGTGKTAAFLLPMLTKLLKKAPAAPRRKVRALILAPTRELAEQIHEAALDLGRATGIRSTTVYGGMSMGRQINNLRNGTDIVVACPGRLLDHMSQRTVDLSGVEMLVLDEADQMFDMGFLPDIKKILAGLPKERHTMLFSATMPEAIRSLANDILKDPETLRVGTNAPTETVSHAIYPVAHHLKTKLLLELLHRNKEGSVLVFTRTKHRAKRLAENLEKTGHKSTALQGNLSQARRKEAMDGFRSGRYRVLVATDIAARGIDVSQITHVVNFDVPSTPETYTHRIGRTGRAERSGEAHTFVTGEDVSMVRAIERLMREPLTRKKIEGFDYNEGPSAADKEFNRPIMDRGRGGYGGGGGGGYGAPRPQQRSSQRSDRPAYGAPRSENSDRRDADGNRSQPGDDIYAADRPARGYGDRSRYGADKPAGGRPGYGRPSSGRPGQSAQGARPQGQSRPQSASASASYSTSR
jgi:ATP-dependent RNA helicase RhlE